MVVERRRAHDDHERQHDSERPGAGEELGEGVRARTRLDDALLSATDVTRPLRPALARRA